KIRGARDKLTKLRKQAGVDDLEELEDLVEAKRKSEEELREARGTLAGELEVDRTDDDDLLTMAEEEMERLGKEIESVGRHSEGYDGREVAELKEREKNVREELREKRRKLKALEDRVDEIKATLRKRNLDPGEPRVIFDRRDEYLRELRNFTVDRLAGNLAREALDRVSSEYFETLDAYLGRSERREGNVGEFFSGVMGDEFEVEFDFERDEFIIHEGDVEYSENSLSSGGKRHLLYATRLALLEGIPTDPAFLILDDPYLFYHKDRKGKAVRQLKKFVKKGWQVLCFTVDRETMNLMVDELGAGYFEIGDL
ncbi:hypothetical protein KGY64_07320, partial [Candidatus Bipolaricaulota bacterium]|nr:hypothetical protein [Candidatus Bipolaricaulota bacterium]